MRVFVLVEPKFFTPPEMFPTLLDGFAGWRDTHREHMDSFEFFRRRRGLRYPQRARRGNPEPNNGPVPALQRDNGAPHTRRGYRVRAVAGNHGRVDRRGSWSGAESVGEHQPSAYLTGPGLS